MPKRPRRPRRPRQTVTKLITTAELARRRGVDERTVRRWVRAGCPVARRGKAGHTAPRFDVARVKAWLAKSDTEERSAREAFIARIDAQARRARELLARLIARHVRAADVTAQWAAFTAHARTRIQAMADALAAALAAGAPVYDTAAAAARAVLVELSTTVPRLPAAAPLAALPPVSTPPARTLRAAHAQRAAVEAVLVTLRTEIAGGSLVLVDDARLEGQSRAHACKTRLLALASTLMRVADGDRQAALRRTVGEALDELRPHPATCLAGTAAPTTNGHRNGGRAPA